MRQQRDKMSENKHSIIFASFPSTAGETHSPGGLERAAVTFTPIFVAVDQPWSLWAEVKG